MNHKIRLDKSQYRIDKFYEHMETIMEKYDGKESSKNLLNSDMIHEIMDLAKKIGLTDKEMSKIVKSL